MSYWMRNGNRLMPTSQHQLQINDTLPVGTYVIKHDQFSGFYLEITDVFKRKDRIYGSVIRDAERILETFLSRNRNTGVLLSGEKGSGKTLTAQMVSIIAAQTLCIPTILVNTAFSGDAFNTFLQSIGDRCIVLFDEFEKTYDNDKEQQIQLLTLFDGVVGGNNLFLLTVNEKFSVNKNMVNRPGRIFYHLEYAGLEPKFIREYCEENLIDKHYINQVCNLGAMFWRFNFDMLQALVEEMNRYNESPLEAIKFLNSKPDSDESGTYVASLTIDGASVQITSGTEISGIPVKHSRFRIYYPGVRKDEDGDLIKEVINFSQNHLYELLPQEGKYYYRNGNKVLTWTKKKSPVLDEHFGYRSLIG